LLVFNSIPVVGQYLLSMCHIHIKKVKISIEWLWSQIVWSKYWNGFK